MTRIKIRHKCIMVARNAARRGSMARETGRSVFIKRYYGSYRLIAVMVSEGQRSCRDMFAEAQRLASSELKRWNRRRHWGRLARRHGVKGAHRMAVSWFYGMLKENGSVMHVELGKERERDSDRVENVSANHEMARVFTRLAEGESMLRWEKRCRRGDGVVGPFAMARRSALVYGNRPFGACLRWGYDIWRDF